MPPRIGLLTIGSTGVEAAKLHRELIALGQAVPDDERTGMRFGEGTARLVRDLQREGGLEPTGVLDVDTVRVIERRVSPIERVTGRVTSPDTTAVGGLIVRVVNRGVGRDRALGEGTTDPAGRFDVAITERRLDGKPGLDLQVVVLGTEDRVLGRSSLRVVARTGADLDVRLPEGALTETTEYDALIAALGTRFDGLLAGLRETPDRPDISLLSATTGWDARAVALAALSDRLAADAEGLEAEHFYALLRAGLPAEPSALARVATDSVTAIWERAGESRLMRPLRGMQVKAAVRAFDRFRDAHALQARVDSGGTDLDGLLALSIDSVEDRRELASVVTRAPADDVWAAVEEWVQRRGLANSTLERLHLDSGLSRLTLGNVGVIRRLRERVGDLREPGQLAERGFHRRDRWLDVIDPGEVPEAMPGETDQQRAGAYAELLSAAVRLTWPTRVVAARLRDPEDALTLPETSDEVREEVAAFFADGRQQFELGEQPFRQYARDRELPLSTEARSQVELLQRLYQVTPDDETLGALIGTGLRSARDIAALPRARFVATHEGHLGGTEAAERLHSRASDIHAVAIGLTMNYLTARTDQSSGGVGRIIGRLAAPTAEEEQTAARATLETLFGSLDACRCEHCNSMLSPAAYLVDLLGFLDQPDLPVNPLDQLLARRPDIEQLPLSCDNTTVSLPLIDMVNEILSHLIGNDDLGLTTYRGHDTPEGVIAEDLRAAPAFDDLPSARQADAAVAAASFPPPLPYSVGLDRLRRLLALGGLQLSDVMRCLRADDELDAGGDALYGWRDIRLEQAGLDPGTRRLLTDPAVTLADHFGYPAGTSDNDVRTQLSQVQTLIRRVRLSYDDVVALLHTRYLNPGIELLGRLEALGVPVEALRRLRDGTLPPPQFRASLGAGFDEAAYGGDVVAWVRDDARWARIAGLLTLVNPTDPQALCRPADLELRSLGDNAPSRLRAGGFVRLARLLRLWRGLGWPLADVDAALWALLPEGARPDGSDAPEAASTASAGWNDVLLGLGVMVEALDRLGLQPESGVRHLVALWAPMDTVGADSLYRRLFLQAPGIPEVFRPGPDGRVLTRDEDLMVHEEAVRRALRISGQDWAALLTALGVDDTTRLTLEVVTDLYRRGWLARVLGLSVRELLVLLDCTGLDPFSLPTTAQPDLLKVIGLVHQLRGAGFGTATALYLLWDQDLRGQVEPPDEAVRAFAVRLRAELTAAAGALGGEEQVDDQQILTLLGSVYGPEVAEFAHAVLTGAVVFSVRWETQRSDLPPEVLDASRGTLSYDDVRDSLTHRGVLTEPQRNTLQEAGDAAGLDDKFREALDKLRAASETWLQPVLDRHPDLRAAITTYLGTEAPEPERRAALITELVGPLLDARLRQQAVFSAAADVAASPEHVEAVLLDEQVLPANRAAATSLRPSVDDLLALRKGGLTARFWTGGMENPPVEVREAVAVDHAPDRASALPTADGPVSGTWSGALTANADGPHELIVEVDEDAQVTLSIGGSAVPLTPEASENGEQPRRWVTNGAVNLLASTATPLKLTVTGVRNRVRLLWRAAGTTRSGREPVPTNVLFAESALTDLQATNVRLRKAASIAQILALSPATLQWSARHLTSIGGRSWLHSLGVSGQSRPRPEFRAVLDTLLVFVRLSAKFPGGAAGLLAHLEDPAGANDARPHLDRVMGWVPAHTDSVLDHLSIGRVDLGHLEHLDRLIGAMEMAADTRVPAPVLLSSITNNPGPEQTHGYMKALQARYDERAWREVIQPVNDDLRRRRRDALVALTLARFTDADGDLASIDTPERLYERLLIDVQMDPCMPTSRVRQAISATQQFIDRILLGLEPGIAPDAIDPEQWSWMSRYRFWEVLRMLLLYPENWLEPELRDDQSPLFRTVVGELLQGDVTEDRAALALGKYLSGLEGLARLEPVGVYDEAEAGGPEAVHVVARTAGRDRSWYYRRCADGSWSPWQLIDAGIEGDPVLPVVWRGRLFIFWLRITKDVALGPSSTGNSSTSQEALGEVSLSDLEKEETGRADNQQERVCVALAFSEYVDGAWTPARSGDSGDEESLGTYDVIGSERFNRQSLKMTCREESDGALLVGVTGEEFIRFRLYSPVSNPVPVSTPSDSSPSREPSRLFMPLRNFPAGSLQARKLHIEYTSREKKPGGRSFLRIQERSILHGTHPWSVLQPGNLTSRPWTSPFFASDQRHVFYVTTRVSKAPRLAISGGLTAFTQVSLKAIDLAAMHYEVSPLPGKSVGGLQVPDHLSGLRPLRALISNSNPVWFDDISLSVQVDPDDAQP